MTFHEHCCRHFGCKPEEYEEVVFWNCVFSRSKNKARLMHAFNPDFFQIDRKLIRALAGMTSYAALEGELVEFREAHIADGYLRDRMRLRLSTTKIARLGAQLFRDGPPEAS